MEKKGIQLNQAFGAVLTLVLVATLVIIAIVIFVNLSDSFAGTSSATVTNETSAYLNTTGYTLDNASACQFADPTITAIWGKSGGAYNVSIPVANASVTAAGVVTNATTYTNNDVSYSYTYNWGSESCTASENMIGEFDNYTSLIGLVGTIIFLGLVIGVLVASFVFSGREV